MKYQQICLIQLAFWQFLLQLHSAEAEEQLQPTLMPPTSTPTPYDICFEQYAQRTANASATYAAQYSACQEAGNRTRFSLLRDKQPEREQIKESAAAICAQMGRCDTFESDVDFFECHANNGLFNMKNIIAIRRNSSLALIDLEDQYNDAEKAVLKCNIEVQHKYAQETAAAFDDLTLCLKDWT